MGISVFELVVVYTALMGLAGLAVYLMFYKMFYTLYGRKVATKEPEKGEVTMCGELLPSKEFVIPVGKVFTDIMSRSFRKWFKALGETAGTVVLQDWFFYMLVVLIAIVVIAIIVG